MRKQIFTFLLAFGCSQAFAQYTKEATATFNFNSPSSLNCSTNLEPSTVRSGDVPITDYTFTSGNVRISFGRGINNGGRVSYETMEPGSSYDLKIGTDATMTFSGINGAQLTSIKVDENSILGDLYFYSTRDPVTSTTMWTGNASSVQFGNSSAWSRLKVVTVDYTTPADILEPTSDLSSTVSSFSSFNLTFSDKVYASNTSGITISNGKTTQNLSASVNGNKVTLSLADAIATDGTYTITVPAMSFTNAGGYGNSALTYTVTVSTPKNTYKPVTITPAPGKLDSLVFPIRLSFSGAVVLKSTQGTLQKDGKDYARLTFAKDGNHDVLISSSLITEPLRASSDEDKGVYTIDFPEGTVYDGMEVTFNPDTTLTYTLETGTTPDEPDTPDTPEETQTMKDAKALLLNTGVGYPATSSSARTALAALTTATETPTDEELTAAMGAFYKETDITLPTAGSYYKIYGVNASGSKAYLHYANGAVTLSSSEADASAFEAEIHDTAVVFKTTDGKYLHTLCGDNYYDATTTANVTDAHGKANDLQMKKLAVYGVDSTATFGLVYFQGLLGKYLDAKEESQNISLVHYGTTLLAITNASCALYFDDSKSVAFKLEETAKPAADTTVVETAYTILPKQTTAKAGVTLTFPDLNTSVVLTQNSSVEPYIANESGNRIESIPLNPVSGTNNQFLIPLSDYQNATYHIVLPEGTFFYTLNGAPVKTQAIDETIIIKSDTTPDNPTHSGDFADFDYTLSVNPNAGTSISDTDLNNFTLSLYKGFTQAGGLCVDATKQVKIVNADDASDVYATGHLEATSDANNWIAKLVLDKPLVAGTLRQNHEYTIQIPAGTYGDANFGKYLADPTSVSATACHVNTFDHYQYYIDNAATGIKFVNSDEQKQVIYDLLGRRVERVTKTGIYIVNGKKMVIRK